MRKVIQQACAALDRATWFLAVALLALMSVLVIGELIARYLFSESSTWVEELTRYLMVWLTMIGSASALYRGELIGVDFLISRVPAHLRRLAIAVVLMFIAAFLLILVYYGYRLVDRSFVLRAAALQVPMAWFYLAVPVGGALMLIQTIGLLVAPPDREVELLSSTLME